MSDQSDIDDMDFESECYCDPANGVEMCNQCIIASLHQRIADLEAADALAKLRADLQRSEFKRAQYEERLGMVDAQMLHIINENNARWRKRDAEMAELEKDRARLDFLLAGPAGICIGLKWGAVSTREEIDNVMKEE